jgi:FAD:protein FMN transferase
LKQTRILMGMPITLEVVDPPVKEELFDAVYDYFRAVDDKFSTYKDDSEISRLNRHELTLEETSQEMKTVLALTEEFKLKTNGYFNIQRDGVRDPSGLVKGWAILNAAEMIRQNGCENFYVEAGGDIQAVGKNSQGQNWRVGIRNPYNMHEIVKVLSISGGGVATSGTYVRGQHIYNPKNIGQPITEIVSLTVVGPDIYTADCYATAAFAMETEGIRFIESLEGFEGYMIDDERQATFTSGFSRYVIQ